MGLIYDRRPLICLPTIQKCEQSGRVPTPVWLRDRRAALVDRSAEPIVPADIERQGSRSRHTGGYFQAKASVRLC
jgi:hypothetical protein